MKVVSYVTNRRTQYTVKSYDLKLECGHVAKFASYRASEYLCWCEKRYELQSKGVSGTGYSSDGYSNDIDALKATLSLLKTKVQPWVIFVIRDRKTGDILHTEKAS